MARVSIVASAPDGSRWSRFVVARWSRWQRSLATLAVVLCGAHYASVAWPSLAYRPEIARPLRLDRPDSFGCWFMVALLAGSAGTSFLIYQLRRYRNDDFTGRYRLWRLVLVVMVMASVNAHVSIIDWVGALLEVGFGKRVALIGRRLGAIDRVTRRRCAGDSRWSRKFAVLALHSAR